MTITFNNMLKEYIDENSNSENKLPSWIDDLKIARDRISNLRSIIWDLKRQLYLANRDIDWQEAHRNEVAGADDRILEKMELKEKLLYELQAHEALHEDCVSDIVKTHGIHSMIGISMTSMNYDI